MNEGTGMLHEFFTERVETQFGTIPELRRETSLKGHVVGILEKFTRADELYRTFACDGRFNATVDKLLVGADPALGTASSFEEERQWRIFIGDLILYATGIRPESIRWDPILGRVVNFTTIDFLRDVAKKNYLIASQFNLHEYKEDASLFLALAEHFDRCEYGLYLVRQSFGQGGGLHSGMGIVH